MADEATTETDPVETETVEVEDTEATETETDAPEPDEPAEGETWDQERYKRTISRKNNEAKNLRERFKALEAQYAEAQPLIQAAKDAEDAKKSELERAQEQIAALQTKAVEKARTHAVARLTDKGLTEDQVALLAGDTEEALEASEAALLKAFAQAVKTPKPKPGDLSGGRTPSEKSGKPDPKALGRSIRLY